MLEGSGCFVRQDVIIRALNEYFNTKGHIPENLDEFSTYECHIYNNQKTNMYPFIQYQQERYDLRYYPEAWGKPGKMFLVSAYKDGYIVTFGDGSRAILSEYYISDLKEGEIFNPHFRRYEIEHPKNISQANPFFFPILVGLIIPLVLLVIIIFYDIIFSRKTSPSENEN